MSEVQSGSFRLITDVANRDIIEESPAHTMLIKDHDRLTKRALRTADVTVILIKTPGVQLIRRCGYKRPAIPERLSDSEDLRKISQFLRSNSFVVFVINCQACLSSFTSYTCFFLLNVCLTYIGVFNSENI